MKKTYINSQSQAHMFGFWINNKTTNGIVNKKKNISNIKICIKDKIKIKDEDEDDIITRLTYIIRLLFY